MKKINFDQIIKIILTLALFGLGSCASYERFKYITEEFEIPSKVFRADYNQSWLAVIEVMKKYTIAVKDQEAGVIKTRWEDNTREVNFSDSFGSNDAIKAARFKLVVNVVKGFRSRREVTKITVYRRQMIEQDFLQGWKIIPSDGILEKSIIYRIGREIDIRNKIRKVEEKRSKELEANF